MSEPQDDLTDADFSVGRSRLGRIKHRVVELPSRLRLAGQGAWRGKERGLAVIAGVFLASLVITTVLAYGVGLSQLFFEESLKSEPFDAKIEYARTPVENASGWSNNTSTMVEVCDELMDDFHNSTTAPSCLVGRAFTVQACSTSNSSSLSRLKCGASPTTKTHTGAT